MNDPAKSAEYRERNRPVLNICIAVQTFSLLQIIINSIEIIKLNVISFNQPLSALPFEMTVSKLII